MNDKKFYVYEHWRTDRNECFYVGKGQGKRAWKFDPGARGRAYLNLFKEIGRAKIDVKLVFDGLDEQGSFDLEIERISHWRSLGIAIVNMTDGGEGASGNCPSEETRQKLSVALKGKLKSPEHKARTGAALKGNKNSFGLKRCDEDRAAIRARSIGRKHTPETREKMRLAKLGTKRSPEVCKKISDGHKARLMDEAIRAVVTARLAPYCHLPPNLRSNLKAR